MQRQWAIVFAAAVIAFTTARADAPARLPVPDAALQDEALKLVKSLFKEEFAQRKTEERRAFALKLLQQAEETKDDPAGKFVLFSQAQSLAVEIGDVELALQAADRLSRVFAIDAVTEKTKTLSQLAALAKTPASAKAVAMAALNAADEEINSDQFDAADALLAVAERATGRSKDAATVLTVRQRLKSTVALRQEFGRVAVALKTLKDSPNDGEANTVVGRYDCFRKGRWTLGVPRLAKSNDPDLRGLADKDLGARDSESRAKAANAWWTWGEKQDEAVKSAAWSRAAQWYELALPGLTGLSKTTAERRLKLHTPLEVSKKTDWTVIFRADDPKVWNTNVTGKYFAMALDKVSEDLKFVRLKRLDTSDFLILPITLKELGSVDVGGTHPYRWNGSNKDEFGGRHLGIAQGGKLAWQSNKGIIAVANDGWEPFAGSGFGHKHNGDQKTQGYSWKGKEIRRTTFEIAVSPGPLTTAEQKALLKKD